MAFHFLPSRNAGAAENMAIDFLMLQRYPADGDIRFRHYGWHRPAFTFGYSQKIAFVRAQLPAGERPELCRRPTGGGVVDHRFDWTYALVIPRGHPTYDARAVESYRVVHSCLADALKRAGAQVTLKERCEPETENAACAPGICFVRPELYDVVDAATGQKVSGAAQKRNKHGLLFQGSVSRAALKSGLDFFFLETQFAQVLARALQCEITEPGWPDFPEEETSQLVEHYSSSEWNEFR